MCLEMAASVSSGSGGESLKANCLQDRLSPGSQCTFALFLVATALFPWVFLASKDSSQGIRATLISHYLDYIYKGSVSKSGERVADLWENNINSTGS